LRGTETNKQPRLELFTLWLFRICNVMLWIYIMYLSIDFSIADWMEDKGVDIGESLGKAGAELLMQQLGLDKFLRDTPCDRTRAPYTPSVNGWQNGIVFHNIVYLHNVLYK
jgi:hypothetical protein